jgi:hypothetical protein
MITQDAFILGKSLMVAILRKMDNLSKPRSRFICEILMLFLSHRGRLNFLQMARQGSKNEKSYRNQFDQGFDWLNFNKELVNRKCSNELIIGFDPSYISKSGKHSPGLGYFYSGCAGKYKKGLEIGSFAVIDVKQNTAYHLEATQTPSANKEDVGSEKTLVDHYGDLVVSKAEQLEQISDILVCDGYFSKIKYVDKVCNDTNLELISRLRDDANLKYIYHGPIKSGRGRPRKYAGKVDVKNIDKRRFKLVHEDDKHRIYWAIVKSVGLDREISLSYVEFIQPNGKKIIKLFFSTNVNRSAEQILKYYQARYQMEFIFRDAKQYTGLEHCQARNENKLNFHFNASMTAISIAKGIIRSGVSKSESMPLSISDIKTELQNRNMLFRIFSIYGFDQKLIKMNELYRNTLNFGKIAA